MIGNFLYGYLPYRIWHRISSESPSLHRGKQIIKLILIALLASGACGLTIGWGVDLLGFVPFAALGNIIVLNNFVIAAILSPVIMRILYTRVERWGLLYRDTMEAEDRSEGITPRLGLMLVIIGVLGGLILGNMISFGLYDIHHPFTQEAHRGLLGIGLGLTPAILLMILGAILL
jgi:energy-coupling factor transport system substrate-specific component